MPLPEISGALGIKRAAHLLRRAAFGATKQQIDSFALLTASEAVTKLFPANLPDPLLPIDPKTGTEWVYAGVTDANSKDGELEDYFLSWFLGQMLSAGVADNESLAYATREKIVLFLHTHFTTIKSKVSNSRALYFQNQLLRLFALDGLSSDPLINIKELTVKISIDNAMLKLLDGNLNVKGSPNENYARELHELYTIGRGLEGSLPPTTSDGDYIVYTEADIQAAAKVLSGWEVAFPIEIPFDPLSPNTQFGFDEVTKLPRGKVRGSLTNASAHDNSVKTFSQRFNNNTISPDPLLLNGGAATEQSALDEIRKLIDQIYTREETAKNICWKIYRFFVFAPHTKEQALTIDSTIITTMANTLVSSGYKILPVIQNLFRSTHFYDSVNAEVKDDNFGSMIKSPIDLVIGTLRSFDIKLPSPTDTTNFYMATGEVLGHIGELGMNFFEPYDVAGYEAYHQFPIYHRFWITPNTLANRYKFVREVATAMEPGILKAKVFEYVDANFNSTAQDSKQLIIDIATYFFSVTDNLDFDESTTSGITAKRLNYFKERFLQGFDEAYWTTNWNNRNSMVKDWLEILFNNMLQSPEYQLA